ncbi:hypothetical protein MMC08_008756 [Hypocenomyce scalaris]|nr:hypothetical protein [Hypocenomyce scalaris]
MSKKQPWAMAVVRLGPQEETLGRTGDESAGDEKRGLACAEVEWLALVERLVMRARVARASRARARKVLQSTAWAALWDRCSPLDSSWGTREIGGASESSRLKSELFDGKSGGQSIVSSTASSVIKLKQRAAQIEEEIDLGDFADSLAELA